MQRRAQRPLTHVVIYLSLHLPADLLTTRVLVSKPNDVNVSKPNDVNVTDSIQHEQRGNHTKRSCAVPAATQQCQHGAQSIRRDSGVDGMDSIGAVLQTNCNVGVTISAWPP